ncbi:protein of unknown function (DUF4095) [Gaiella occulta]|uniref:AbiEi antitoxin N-terminal domain-containing protein n=1 Tax=Gaiella occulta TaxID=1002870 RepID=A0A7M2YVN5_9ACTN|nr:type IV toxin-antitoxin system AbiEi family antitoxin domain-containing protein [Gaiella occulta]RDI73639.1 protein of unknown function (DUF4095) [Gaiella occulta]
MPSVAERVEKRIARRPGRVFTFADFADLPASAVAPALSRLTRSGKIRRARKGVYYAPKDTVLGEVPIDPIEIGRAANGVPTHLAGLSAASALGLTTQVPARAELAVEGRRTTGATGVVTKPRFGTRRAGLEPAEAALLEVLRSIVSLSELSPEETVERLANVLRRPESMRRVLHAAVAEPPRVRAMVGALAEHLGAAGPELKRLRSTLNPTSRYRFGPLAALPTARHWGAR